MSCCLIQQQSRLMIMHVISITGILWHIKSWTLYLCMGFDCGWCMRVSSHWQKNRSAFISKMIMRVRSFHPQWLWQSLPGGCKIIALLGIKTFLECHVLKLMWLLHNQKHSVCQTSFRQTTQVNFCCQHCQLVSCMLVKTLWLPVNNLHHLGTVVWQPSNIVQQGVFRFQTSFGYKEFYAVDRKIYLLYAVCLQSPLQRCCCSCLHHGSKNPKALVVKHFGMCCALCDLHRILETYLRAAAAQVVLVVWPLFFKVIYFEIRTKECVSSFPFLFLCYFLTSCQKCVQSQSGIMYLVLLFSPLCLNQSNIVSNFWTWVKFKADWGMSITLFLLFFFLSYSFD